MSELEQIMGMANDEKERMKTGQMGLFGGGKPAQGSSERYSFNPQPEWNSRDKLEKEKEVIGFYLSEHPLDEYKPVIEALAVDTYKDLLTKVNDKTYTAEPVVVTCGLLQSNKVITTRKGDRMSFAQFEDLSGSSEVVIFPRVFAKSEPLLTQYNEFIIVGSLDIASSQQCKVKANALLPLQHLLNDGIEHAVFELKDSVDEAHLTQIKDALKPGKTPLSLQFAENKKNLLLTAKDRYALSADLLKTLREWGVTVRLHIRGE